MSGVLKQWLRGVLAAGALSALATGCVRLNEPDVYICQSNADCEAGQECKYEECRPAGFCEVDYECDGSGAIISSSGQICVNQRCAPAECTPGNPADCQGYKCYGGRCEHACYTNSACEDGYHCSAESCVAGKLIANGGACTSNPDCESQACCPSVGGSVCAKSCAISGEACTSALDCITGFCCQGSFGGGSICSAMACPPPPECNTSGDCPADKVCELGKCVLLPVGKGKPCQMNEQCESGSCMAGVCRGTAGEGDDCDVDSDCQAKRLCCTAPYLSSIRTCSEVDRGCPGSIGDACDFASDCLQDNCNGSFCTKACTTNADCGTSPWGVANACETNGLGNKICFPGCQTTQQCTDNLDDFGLSCYEALDSAGRICAAG